MKKLNFTPLQLITHISVWLPLTWFIIQYSTDINPIQAFTQRTGKTALILLVLSLACTPVITLFGLRQVGKIRRALGLYAFMYAAIHFFTFIGLDYGFDWSLLQGAIFEKTYILVGLSALIILSILGATSFRYWQKRLGKNWKRLHKLVYLAGGLVIFHYGWAKKGDFLRLQGDVVGPVSFGLLVAFLLILRIPAVRRWASGLRGRFTTRVRALTRTQTEQV
jgi:methionine sulfoxide reductase heme-binding subunit